MRHHSVASADGTPISYVATACAPGIVIVPGSNRMAHDYAKLAAALGAALSVPVAVIERRGRGASGPRGAGYSLETEVEDLHAVLHATGSVAVFGHSYGGLIALRAAMHIPTIRSLVAYEPTVSIDGSFDLSWLPEFERALAAGKAVTATAIFLRRAKLAMVSDWPRPLQYVLAFMLLRGRSGRQMRTLMPTIAAEIRETLRADSDGRAYAAIEADTLLLAGENGARPLNAVLPKLQSLVPTAHYVLLPKLHHNSPDLGPVESIVAAVRTHLQNASAS